MKRRTTRGALAVLAGLTVLYLIAPVFVVVPISFGESSYLDFPPENLSMRWYSNYFEDTSWVDSTLASLKIGLLVTVLSVVLGTLAALGMVRGRYPLRGAVAGLVLAPVLVPYVIVGLAVYAAFLRAGLTQTTLGFVLIHTCLAVPYVVINVSAALFSFDRTLELAAMSLGAGPVGAFVRVTLPIIAPSVLTGALFAFVTSFDEVVTSVFLSGPELTTLPVQMWSGVRVTIDPTVAAVSSMLLLVTLCLFTGAGVARAFRTRRIAR